MLTMLRPIKGMHAAVKPQIENEVNLDLPSFKAIPKRQDLPNIEVQKTTTTLSKVPSVFLPVAAFVIGIGIVVSAFVTAIESALEPLIKDHEGTKAK